MSTLIERDTQNGMPAGVAPETMLRIALATLAPRVQKWATLAVASAFFGYVVYEPTTLRIVAASCFTVLVHIPTWFWKERR